MPTYSAGSASLTIVPDAREFRSKLESDLRKERVDFAVQVGADLARARGDFDTFRAEQEGRAIKLRAEVDRDHMRGAIDSMRKDFEGLGKSLSGALKIDAAAIGIDLLPALATGLVEVAQAIQQVAQAGLAVPGIMAGIGASIGTLALSLDGVKDAWSAVDKASDESGANQARQAQQAQSAITALRNAKVDELGAEKDLAQAYRDSRQQLEDLNIAVRGGALSEKEAILEAQKARRDLATGRYKDALDYQAAQLRVEEADQRVVESRQHNIELSDKVRDANAKGITNSDRVVAANERLTRSHQAVQQAQASLAEVGVGGAADKAAQAMAKLAPNARQFVQTMLDLKPAFTGLEQGLQQNLFAGLSQQLRTLVDADLPSLKTGMGGIATAWNHNIGELMKSLGSDSSKGFLDRILGNTANAQDRLTKAIDPIVHAVGVLTAAGSNTLPRLADAIGHVADRFDKFISAAAADGRLDKWINEGLDGLTHLGDIVLNLGKSFTAITEALGGKGLLASLDDASKKLSTFLNSADGQEKLKKFFKEAREEFHKWEPVIADLAKTLPALFDVARETADSLLTPLKNIGSFMADHKGLVTDVITAYLAWKTVLEPIGAITKAIGGVSTAVKAFIKEINAVGPAANVAATEVEGAAAREVTAEQAVEAEMQRVVAAQAHTPGTVVPGGKPPRSGTNWLGLGAAILAPIAIADAINPDTLPVISNLLQGKDKEGTPLRDKYVSPVPPSPPPDKDPTGGQGLGGLAGISSAQGGLGGAPPPAAAPPAFQHPDAWKSLADSGDPLAKWVLAGKDPDDQQKRADYVKAHLDEIKQSKQFQPPPSYGSGGPTPSGAGPLDDGGYNAVIHPKEFVISERGRSQVPDSFLHALNKGMVDSNSLPHFDKGGPADPKQPPAPLPPGWTSNYSPWPWDKADSSMAIPDRGLPGGVFNPGIKIDTSMATSSSLPHFDDGGPGDGWLHDQKGDPRDAPVNPGSIGPQGIAPNPTGAGPGILNSLISGVASGVQGPIGNAIGLASGLIQQGQGQGQGSGGGGGGGGNLIPGVWGLAQAGASSNPQAALTAWGTQTASWLGNFAGKTLSSAADIGVQGVLGGIGLSGLQAYGQAAEKVGGFYLGSQSPFASLGGTGGVADAGGIGSQSIGLGDGNSVQIPTYGTAQGVPGLPADPDAKFGSGAANAIAYAKGHAVGQAYVYGGVGGGAPGTPGGYDCSGIASAIYAAAKGLPQGTRYFTTESDFAALGFVPGYAPGSLNIGVMRGGGGPNSHMAVTLPNGVAVESGGSGNSTQYGGSARGAQTFPLQFHLSLPGSMPPPGGIPGLPPTLYDEGGALPTGLSLVSNQTSKPETVITHQQTQALQAVANHVSSQPTPTPSLPQSPDAGHMQAPATAQQQPQIPPALQQPQSTAAAPVPSPGGSTPEVPTPTQTGGAMSPSKAPTAVAPAPTNLDHNLKAIDTGIDSAAQAIGQGVSTAIGVAASLAGSSGFAPGAGAAGAIGPYVAGAIQEGGKIVKNVVNIPSSFLVGNVTAGTQDLAYGAALRPAQNNPNTGPLASVTNYNVSGNYELRSAMDAMELHDAQKQQAALASHPRTPGT